MKPSKVLVTAAGPNMLPVLRQYTLPAFERFAEAQQYQVQVEELAVDSLARKNDAAKHARWHKIELLRQALARHEVVAWFDADVLIRRFDDDPAMHLRDDAFQGLVLHAVPAERRINPNTGVWILRNAPESFEFLDIVQGMGLPEGRWADQGAVMRALEWTLGDDRYFGAQMPERHNRFLRGTAWLPIGWNQPHCEHRSNPDAYVGRPLTTEPHAVHLMAMTIEERLAVLPELVRPV